MSQGGWDEGKVRVGWSGSPNEHAWAASCLSARRRHRRCAASCSESRGEASTRAAAFARARRAPVTAPQTGGVYQRAGDGVLHFGSPAILIEATAAAQAQVNKTRQKPVTIQPAYFFIDKRASGKLETYAARHISARPVRLQRGAVAVAPAHIPGVAESRSLLGARRWLDRRILANRDRGA